MNSLQKMACMKNKNGSKPHVCLVTSSLVGGGAEKLNLTLYKHLIRQGIEVTLVVLSSRNVDYENTEGLEIFFLDQVFQKPLLGFLEYRYKAKCLDQLLSQIETRKGRFDCIVASLSGTHKLMSRLRRTNVFYWIHNTLSQELLKYGTGRKYRNKIREYIKTYRFKKIIATSQGVKSDLIKIFELESSSIHVLYNFFDFNEIGSLAKEPFKLPFISKQYLIHAGRFSSQKRHDILLEAFKKTRTDLPLVLLCKSSKALNNLIESKGLAGRVYVAGFQQNPYVWIKNAKALLLTSDYEGFGNVIVESLFVQTPVVSTDCPSGPSEIMEGAYSIGLCKKGNPSDIALKLESVLTSDVVFDRQELRNKYSVDRFIKELRALCCL